MATKYWVGGTGNLDGSDTTHISDTSGGAGGATYPTSSDNLVFNGSSGGGTVTVTVSPTLNSIDMSSFGGTINFGATNPTFASFTCNGTGVRTLNMGSGTWTITGNAGAVWNFNNISNLTFNGGTAVVNFTYAGSVGTRSFFINLPTVRPYRVNITAGTDTIDFSSGNFEDLDFTGFSGTLDTDAFTVAGNLTLSPTMTIPTSANALTFTATTTGKTITMNGVAFNRPITFNGVGGGWTLQDNLDMSGASIRTLTLTAGTLDANGKNVTCGAFASSNSNTRTWIQGSGIWSITGNNTTIYDVTTVTGLTFTKGANPIRFTYSGSTGTRTIVQGSLAAAGALSAHPDFSVTAGTDTIAMNASRCGHLVFTGFSGTLASGIRVVYGNLTISSTMTWASGTSTTTFSGTSGTQVITTNGVRLNSPFTVDGVGGTVQLADNFSMDGASARALALTNGTFDSNGFTVTCGSWSSNNSNVRTLLMGTSTWYITGTGTVFNNGGANSTASMASSTIIFTDISSSTKALSSGTGNGSGTFGTITLMPGGSGSFTFNANARTINTLNVSGPKTVVFTSGTTTTITNWNVNGMSGALVTISATTPGSAATISVASGIINSYRLSLQDITATGGATFNAIASINVSGNTGWNFIYTRGRTMNRVAIRNIPYSLVLDGSTGYIEYGNHAAYALGTAGGMSIRFKLAPQQVDTSAANSRFLGTLSDGTLNNFITFIVQNTSPYALVADVRSGGVSNTTTSNVSGLMDGRWYDAAIGWDANGTKIWLLGAVVGVNGAPATSSLGATPNLVSGRLNSGINGRYLTGNLQGLRLFSSKPTDEQIADLHLKGITPSNQVAYWPDDEGSGTSLAVVGSGNAGTLMGGVSWSSTDTPQKSRTAMSNRVACSSRVTTY